jgi:succinate dehydrogenase / fumarate reductase iron-sulfur subunit
VKFRVYRSNPSKGEPPRYDLFEITPWDKMSVLDALSAIQAEQDPTLSFRCSCRAGMCGTCAMMVNGVPRWTCRTSLASLRASTVTVEPLRYFPVVKDLVVDMSPFFEKYRLIVPHVAGEVEESRPVIIRPTEPGRAKIADYLECIGCGCCYAACGLPALDSEYLGPHALNRAYTLIHDRRDAMRDERLEIVDGEHGCWRCHAQASCLDVCPKEISTSDAIQDLKRRVLAYRRDRRFVLEADEIPDEVWDVRAELALNPGRREFLSYSAVGVLGIMALALGIPLAGAAISPAIRSATSDEWIVLGSVETFPAGKMVEKRYRTGRDGSDRGVDKTIYILRPKDGRVRAISPSCTHLGCPVYWNEVSRRFICPCHGGIFDAAGKNVGGPPKRPLHRLETRIEGGRLYLKESA